MSDIEDNPSCSANTTPGPVLPLVGGVSTTRRIISRMSDIEDIPSPNPATLQALRDIVEDMEQMVKDAGGGEDDTHPALAADKQGGEDEEMGGDVNNALCRDSDIDDIDNDTNE